LTDPKGMARERNIVGLQVKQPSRGGLNILHDRRCRQKFSFRAHQVSIRAR
jgi:hypothetical protein